MSIEFDVRVSPSEIRIEDIFANVRSSFETYFSDEIGPSFDLSNSLAEQIANKDSPSVWIRVANDAAVRCDFYFVDLNDTEDGGLWACFGVGIRNNQSILLAAISAAALAKVTASAIVDEGSLLRRGRILSAEDVDEIFEALRGLSLNEAAKKIG